MTEFTSLGLPKALLSRLDQMGIKTPTPIQAQAIPHVLNGRDVMGLAQTGTGKTAAFGLPLIAGLMENRGRPAPKTAKALVLAPTRELAQQIVANLKPLVEGTPIKIGLVVGGQSINAQRNRLAKGTDLVVATPGRLIDHLDNKALRLDDTVFLVLDEADQMLDLGFIHALRKIAGLLPAERQTLLFSATMPKQMAEIAGAYLEDPVRVQVSPPGKAADKITQSVHFVEKSEKTRLLVDMLDKHRDELALVFGRTKHGAERLMKQLCAAGYSADSIHGNKSQGQRTRALQAFRDGKTRVLVATDVAARGLDIPDVRHVYNFDLPNVPDNYVHRIGRTARAGADGAAIAFCAPDEMGALKDIQKVMGISIPVAGGEPWEVLPDPKARKGKGKGPRGQGAGKPGGGQRRRRRPSRNKGQKQAA